MLVNITAGEQLNTLLDDHVQQWVPFNEAMITGTYTEELFSETCCIQRADTHQVSVEEYKTKLQGFLNVLHSIDRYDTIVLWFGNEPFCAKNTEVVIQTLKNYQFRGKLILHTVDEITGIIQSTRQIP